ncbi:MAG: hypothetical protein AAGE01_07765 [Pseudomonadota bacterium]
MAGRVVAALCMALFSGAAGADDDARAKGLASFPLTLGSIPAGQTVTVEFVSTVANPAAAGVDTVSDQATISGDNFSPVQTDDPAVGGAADATSTLVDAEPDLVLAITDDGMAVEPGDPAVFSFDFSNVGNQGATGVTLSTTVPANTTFDAGSSDPGWSCADASPPTTVCNLNVGGVAGGGGSGSADFVVNVDAAIPPAVNSIDVTGNVADDMANGADPMPTDNMATGSIVVEADVDLVLDITNASGPIQTGGTALFSFDFSNDGNIGATMVALSTTVPASTIFNAGASAAGWNCGAGTAGSACTLAVGALAATATGSEAFAVDVDASVPTGFDEVEVMGAIAFDDSAEPDINPTDNMDTDSITVEAEPDLALMITGGPAIVPGAVAILSFDHSNGGDQDATGVTLSTTVPANASFDAAGSDPGWMCAAATPGSACTLTVGPLAAGDSDSAAFALLPDATVASGVVDTTINGSVADDAANGADPMPVDNDAMLTLTIDAAPNLTLAITDDDIPVLPLGTALFVFEFANAGNQDADGVELATTVPPNASFDALGSDGAWVCADVVPGSACTLAVGALAAGANGTADFALTVVEMVPLGAETLELSGTVMDDGSNGTDLNPVDNTAMGVIELDASAELSLTKTDDRAIAVPGETLVYRLILRNLGTQPANDVTLVETVPEGTTFDPVASTAGWSCSGADCTLAIATVGPESETTILFGVTVNSPAAEGLEEVFNEATAEHSSGDDVGTHTTPLDAAPDLDVSLDDGGATPGDGDAFSIAIAVTNAGDQDVSGFDLSVVVPEHATFDAGASDPFLCATGLAGDTCLLSSAQLLGGNGDTVGFTFGVVVDSPVIGGPFLTTTATVSGVPDDDNPDNDTAQVSTALLGTSDLSLTKTGPATAAPGETLSYELTITNAGSTDLTGIVVTETVPANSVFEPGVSDAAWMCPETDAGTVCTLDFGALAVDDVATVIFTVIIDDPLPQEVDAIVNTASAEDDGAGGVDANPDNNTAVAESMVTGEAPIVTGVFVGGSELDFCATTDSLAEIDVAFSESMIDVGADAASNADNYRLVGPGPNRSFDTTGCDSGTGDDFLVDLAVTYDAGAFVATLMPTDALLAGPYRLIACGTTTLRDEDGNALNDGQDFLTRASLQPLNLVTNGDFDCSSDEFTPSDAAAVEYSSEDTDGAGASGSARFLGDGSGEAVSVDQCIGVMPETNYRARADVRVDSASGPVLGRISCSFSQGSNCANPGDPIVIEAELTADGVWRTFGEEFETGSNTGSARCSFGVEDGTFEAFVDGLRLLPVDDDDLLSSGFEADEEEGR